MISAVLFAVAVSVAPGAVAPTCSALPGWSQQGPARLYEGDNLYEYMDGNSEGYLLYGFVRMHGVTCAKGSDKVLIDISEFPDDESAYGMFSANRDVKIAEERIGAGAQVVPRKAIFVKGKYFVELAAEDQGDHSALLRDGAKALAEAVPGATAVPAQISWFPSEGLTAGPPRLIAESVLGIRALKRGYVAQYGAAKAYVVVEKSPEAVADTLKKWLGRYEAISEAQVAGADSAYVVTDKYLGTIVVARAGSRILGYAGLTEGQDGAALTSALLARLPKAN